MSTPWHLSIDFGTSNTAAAHTSPRSGEVETLALTHQGNLMPSAVFCDEQGVYVGFAALNHAGSRPDAYLPSPKRVIEHDRVTLGGRVVETTQLVAAVIAKVLELACAQHAGHQPATVTLTHPEAWSQQALSHLRSGAEAAGIDPATLELISEPRAAARFYSQSHTLESGQRVAVFDFGGGTLDIAVLEAQDSGEFRVVAARGDNSLGGRNVDALVRGWVLEQLEEDDPQLARYLSSAPASVQLSLEHSIRQAKEILSDTPSATITVSTPQGETNLLITRDEFNALLVTDVQRAVALTQAALRDAGADSSITTVYLTGGSARIPYVQDELGKISSVARLDDPKTVVARGALMGRLDRVQGGAAPTAQEPPANPFAGLAAPAAAAAAPTTPQPASPSTAQSAPPAAPQPVAAAAPAQPTAAHKADTKTRSDIPPIPGGNGGSSSEKKSSLPFILGGVGVAAVAMIAAVVLWPSGDDADPDPVTTTAAAETTATAATTSAPATSATTATTAATASAGTGDRGLPAAAEAALPEQLLASLDTCAVSGTAPIVGSAPSGSTYRCAYADSSDRDRFGSPTMVVFTDAATVTTLREQLEANESTIYETRQENTDPLVYTRSLGGDGFTAVAVIDETAGIAFVADNITTLEVAEEYMAAKGLT